ncbi:hypothetical protein BREVNS_0351 [Brevinematales bacterium NS]|nr:hypothetical protein BREVNS_0351 [Brevinematales bacterium NS]
MTMFQLVRRFLLKQGNSRDGVEWGKSESRKGHIFHTPFRKRGLFKT